uniref:uncharacterized protein n=1 Tax=Lonchura striata TaxID=40157 RepID=UPI001293B837|nr:uncharacterized protein LOC116184764 [Lonchura striata domestica]
MGTAGGPGGMLKASVRCLQGVGVGGQHSVAGREALLGGSWGSCSLGQHSKSSPCFLQVPAIVRNIHQRLMSQVTVDAWLQIDIVRLAEEHPADVVLTLLRCAPTCDRAAAMMWRTIGSSSPTVEKVLPVLLCVMENWPLHSIFTSDGDGTDVFALAATLVLWVILQVPECHEAMNLYSPRLFVALLFHAVATTQEIPPEEVAAFWRACWQEHRLDSRLRRFVVRAMKALLCRLQWDHVLVAMERKRGWDTMMRAITQEYGLGLLAREMWRVSIPLCSHTALHLLWHLSKEKPCYDLIFLTVLVEVLECLDLSKCRGSALKTMAKYLWSECCHRHYLALRGLAVLTKDTWMARRMYPLSKRLLELLGAPDVEVVSMSLCVFMNVLQHQDILVSSTTAPKLTEALLLLFDHVRFCILSHRHRLLPRNFVPCGFSGLCPALEAMSEDDSPSSTLLEIQTMFGQRCAELRSSAGFREPGSQAEYQETVKRAPGLHVTRAPGTPDAGHSCACFQLP